MLRNDFVLAPDKTLTPAYRISPFVTADISSNRALPFSDSVDGYFRERFPGRRFVYCETGRQALNLALRQLSLSSADVVTILTTTGNFYISGCVTRAIEKFCRWSRQREADTKALLVNHEFGFAYENLRALRQSCLPIIEDAAHAFASNNAEHSAGTVGDFVIYSFPKFFPIQAGGLLVFDEKYQIEEPLTPSAKRYLQKVLSFNLQHLAATRAARQANYCNLAARFQTIGCSPRFELTDRSIPGVFMFKTEAGLDLAGLKSFMWEHGVESSVFYGESAFFVPVHDRLTEGDLEYFRELVLCFLERRLASGNTPR